MIAPVNNVIIWCIFWWDRAGRFSSTEGDVLVKSSWGICVFIWGNFPDTPYAKKGGSGLKFPLQL